MTFAEWKQTRIAELDRFEQDLNAGPLGAFLGPLSDMVGKSAADWDETFNDWIVMVDVPRQGE